MPPWTEDAQTDVRFRIGKTMKLKKLAILSALLLTSCTGLDAGWKAQRAGDYDEAQRQAIIALSKEPRNPSVYQLIATTALSKGQYDSALKAAEFASSLDGGSEKSETLIRDIQVARKNWEGVCEIGQKAVQAGRVRPGDAAIYRESYDALSGKGESYGCLQVLEASGEEVEGGDAVKSAYAAALAAKGLNREALRIEETVAEPAVRQLRASQRLYALQRPEEGRSLLRDYIEQSDGSSHETRIKEASEVAEMNRDWGFSAEILSKSELEENEIRHAIALRRSFRPEESDALLTRHFERTNRDAATVLDEVNRLSDAGYGEKAAQAYFTCQSCQSDVDMSLLAADKLYQSGELSATTQLIGQLGESHSTDAGLQKRLFDWCRKKNLNAQALVCAERAAKLGPLDDDFQAARLELYVANREIRTYERESSAWIASLEAPAMKARETIARIDAKRNNWQGVFNALDPAAQSVVFEGKTAEYYFKSLRVRKEHEALYKALERHGEDLTALEKSQYFDNAETEDLFKKCLEPLLSGAKGEKLDAELALAVYYLTTQGDVEAGRRELDKYLEISEKSSMAYSVVVKELRSYGLTDVAIEYTEQWTQAHETDAEPYGILGRLYLTKTWLDKVPGAFSSYVKYSPKRRQALRFGFQEYGRFNQAKAGLLWLESEVLPEREGDWEGIYALTESRQEEYQRTRTPNQELRRELIESYMKLLKMAPDNAAEYGSQLANLKAWPESCEAFDAAEKSGKKLNAGLRITRAQMAIRANKPAQEIRRLVGMVNNDAETFDMVAMLASEQSLEYGDSILEKALSSEKQESRIKAYDNLVRMKRNEGKPEEIKKYSSLLENASPNNVNIRMKIAENALSNNEFDEAVRQLTILQAERPDARDVLMLEMKTARRAPNHAGAQALLATTFDAAEGVYHRLIWISEIFEQFSDYKRALYFAEKAEASSPMRGDSQSIRLLKLELRTGTDITSEEFANRLNTVRASKVWNVNYIQELAEEAQRDGYYDLAQSWMREAISLAPENPTIKRRRLEMALSTESEGLIASSLEKAIDAPVAEVMDPLVSNESMMDAISAIDLFEQTGELEMASASLLRILPYYVEARGITAALRALKDDTEAVENYRTDAINVLAGHASIGETPCEALVYRSELDDPKVWATLIERCPDAQTSLFSSLKSLRAKFIERYKENFDAIVYDTLVDRHRVKEAKSYAEAMGLALTPYDSFERAIYAGNALDALKQVTVNPVSPEDMPHVFSLLVNAGFSREAIDYAENHINEMRADEQLGVASAAVLLGADEKKFGAILPGATPKIYETMDSRDVARLVAVSGIRTWLKTTPSAEISLVIETALKCATVNEGQKAEILQAIDEEISHRSSRLPLTVTVAQSELDANLNKEADAHLSQMRRMLPSSDYVYRMSSVASARMGNQNEAWQYLEEGSLCATDLSDYWNRASEQHSNSPLSLRQKINEIRRSIWPRDTKLQIEAIRLSLENGDGSSAELWANEAYKTGGYGAISQIADAYIEANAVSAIPEVILTENTSVTQQIRGRIQLERGETEAASQTFSDAAKRAPWPPKVYGEAIEAFLEHSHPEKAEQLIALMMKNYPHSATAYAYRAAYFLREKKTEEAWNDYMTARRLSVSTNSWLGLLVRETVLLNEIAFAQKVFEYESSHGSNDETIWLDSVISVSLNETLCAREGKTKEEFARQGMNYLEQVVPQAGLFMRNNPELSARFSRMKSRAAK